MPSDKRPKIDTLHSAQRPNKRRTQPQDAPPIQPAIKDPDTPHTSQNEAQDAILDDLPEDVAQLLAKAGVLAAKHLVHILSDPKELARHPLAAQRAILDLAITRAYGLPIRKSVTVNLSTSEADAVTQSLQELSSNISPKSKHLKRRIKDVTPPT